jgi:hypothetical protein
MTWNREGGGRGVRGGLRGVLTILGLRLCGDRRNRRSSTPGWGD